MAEQADKTQTSPSIPEGFVVIITPDGNKCLVPEFLIPATNEAYDGYLKKVELDINNESGEASTNHVVSLNIWICNDADADIIHFIPTPVNIRTD